MPKSQKRKKLVKKARNVNVSSISQHVRVGTKLVPPLNRMDKVTPTSWRDDHAPEMLWALLLTVSLPRSAYLECFRQLTLTAKPWFKKADSAESSGALKPDPLKLDEIDPQLNCVLDHTKLAELDDKQFHTLIDVVLAHPLGYGALRPLLLIDSLPGIDRWRALLNVEVTDSDWNTLGHAIAESIDHQSEKSTDVRWFKILMSIVTGRMMFPNEMRERVNQLLQFPNEGDLRSVRPSIRALEISARRNPPSKWIVKFWLELKQKTMCVDPTDPAEYKKRDRSKLPAKSLYRSRQNVIERFFEQENSERTDAKLDSSFGFVLFALSLAEEMASRDIQSEISGRLILRSLVEAAITFKYLQQKNDDSLWLAYRRFGSGQAKLAFLHAQKKGEVPDFINEDTIEAIANEDIWQEFLDIDIGNWAKSNLRAIAETSGMKDVYDKYYSWSSTFVHAHWGAVRDTNYITCHNPLHRLHRIPRLLHRELESVESDVISLTNEMIQGLDKMYPGESVLPLLSLKDETGVASEQKAQDDSAMD